MSSNFYNVGLNHVGAYQVSGTPHLTSSTFPQNDTESFRFVFPNVTKRITFKSTSTNNNVRIHFAPYTASFDYTSGASSSANYFTLLTGGEVSFDVKCKEVFISADGTSTNGEIYVMAELTNIPAERMFSLDGVEGVSS